MKILESLDSIKEQVSEETYQHILQLVENSLFPADKRGDLFDDISKALTGKTLGGHLQHGTQKLVDSILKRKKKAKKN